MKTNEIKTKTLEPNTPTAPKEPKTWMYVTGVILLIAAVSIFFFYAGKPKEIADEETTICIAEKSTMYGTDWCGYCKKQKEMFGENVGLLNLVDCEENPTECYEIGVKVYPTWIIDGKTYKGLQSIPKLKELTGC